MALLFMGMLMLALMPQPAEASPWTGETIAINADGSVTPDGAPLSTADKITYTLTDDVNITFGNGIVVKRSNIIIDGAGHTINGTGFYNGIFVDVDNVTIRNLTIKNFNIGIFIDETSNITIFGNNVTSNNYGGIVIDGSSNLNIAENNITCNKYGIHIGWFSESLLTINLTIVGNMVSNNEHGIWIYSGSGIKIVGNSIMDNSGSEDSGVHVSSGVHDTVVCFNNIVGNSPQGSGSYGAYNHPSNLPLNATHNWWGDSSGPSGDGPGLGDNVSSNVDFEPWLTAPIAAASSKVGTDEWLEFPESNVSVDVSGSAEVYVATYAYNPGADFMGDIGNYIDVYVPDASELAALEIRKYYSDGEIEALSLDESGLRMYWWNGIAWIPCSDTGVNAEENYIWAIIDATTTPSLSDLTETPFGVASRPPVGGVIIPAEAPAPASITPSTMLTIIVVIAIAGMVAITRKRCMGG